MLQAGIKIGGRNINNLRYADDTSLMAESKDELKDLLMRVKEESERAGLQLNIKTTTTTNNNNNKLRSWHLAPIEKKESKVKLLSHVRLFLTQWTVAYQAPPSMGFSRQEYWSGLPFPSPGDLPDPVIKPRSPAMQADVLPSEPPLLHDKYQGERWRQWQISSP